MEIRGTVKVETVKVETVKVDMLMIVNTDCWNRIYKLSVTVVSDSLT